jgi:hypothetical protein
MTAGHASQTKQGHSLALEKLENQPQVPFDLVSPPCCCRAWYFDNIKEEFSPRGSALERGSRGDEGRERAEIRFTRGKSQTVIP